MNQVCRGVNFKGILHLNNEKKKPYTEFTVKLVYYRFHGKGNYVDFIYNVLLISLHLLGLMHILGRNFLNFVKNFYIGVHEAYCL